MVYAVGLSLVPGVGAVLYKRLICHFKSARGVFEASLSQLKEVDGVGEKLARAIKGFDPIKRTPAQLIKYGDEQVDLITLEDDSYPGNLKNIPDPPPFLYLRGTLLEDDARAVAIVGTRRCSSYGRAAAERIVGELVSAGITVVSGMALGIDSVAHRAALSAGGRTIGVLGCGLDMVYPAPNRDLYGRIPEQGALLSEFPFGTLPLARNFPQRNRIISGLSMGVLVVEAPARSGALITAALALEQGREVFAVPGTPGMTRSEGCNRLIKMGAKLTESAADILEEILPQLPRPKLAAPPLQLPPEQGKVLEQLGRDPLHVDLIAERSGLPVTRVLAMLMEMELKGLVNQLPGMVFVRGR